jgi:hypothetical protein
VLFAAAVLEHLKYADRILENAHSLLAPHARVIISLPNVAHWGIRLRLLFGQFNYSDYGIMDRTHVHFYTAKTGQALLEQHGYAVDQLYIAGSGSQNLLNQMARRFNRPLPPPFLPGLFAYELIYLAHDRRIAIAGGE